MKTPANIKNDLTARQFGRLTVLGYSHVKYKPSGGPMYFWKVRCSCGTIKAVTSSSLVAGKVVSCGCFQKEKVSAIMRIHGLSRTPTHMSWCAMMNRCTNPNDQAYTRYGGRGITVCPDWFKYANFLADMGPRPSSLHTLERKKNNEGYNKNNCRWATRKEQNRNRRNTIWITLATITKSLAQWAEETDTPYDLAFKRHKRGWSDDKLFLPPRRYK